eukprot:CAMPEP_0185576276 /NCGR_PEP_ID=MMETSP0434-20130131/7238_1 /TAXON_ID=626734 ORGANISM="Favella taraikaensis, Strain Fe Narragansett Bay" /NCGR_SAMPLE_ID=MMETSP0434 /ASSEMBLY_ACC=CAM_ASM_000379 /LENGTH=93 /DNA_ID=CAMNT_0028193407 /DNA_START=1460 /DNA_END=1741 /DNA_ORIENTATION=+
MARRRVMSARQGGPSAIAASSNRETRATASGTHQEVHQDSATLTGLSAGHGRASAVGGAGRHVRNKTGFATLNQPSLVSGTEIGFHELEQQTE